MFIFVGVYCAMQRPRTSPPGHTCSYGHRWNRYKYAYWRVMLWISDTGRNPTSEDAKGTFQCHLLYTICWSIAVTRLAAGIITWLFETLVQLQSDWIILHTNLATSCLIVSNVEISYLILSGTKSAYNLINMRILKFSAVYKYYLSIYVRCLVWDFDCMHNI